MPSKITPTSQSFTWDRVGTPPAITTLLISLIEVAEVEFVQYSFQFENTAVSWLTAPGITGSFLVHDGSTAELPLEFQNLDSLLPGSYKANVNIEISNIDGIIRTVTSVVNLTLTGNAPDAITTDKTNYNVLYNRATNTLSGETHVEIINNTALDTLTLETIGTLFDEVSFTDEFDLVEDAAFPFSTNTELPTSGVKIVSGRLRKAGVFLYGFTITITVIESNELIVTPTNLNFFLRKGFNETQSAVLKITNPLNHTFAITGPPWLTFSATSGSASADITVTTQNSDLLPVGTVVTTIQVAYDGKVVFVQVDLQVVSFIDFPDEPYQFCLDEVLLKVSKMNETGRFVRVTLQMTFATAGETFTEESPYLLPYFNDRVKTDVGEKIQNYFPIFQGHLFNTLQNSFDNKMIYKAASVNIIVEELDINYTVLVSDTIANVNFFAGKTPLLFPLFTNYGSRRKYTDSQFFFSYLSDLVAPTDFSPTAGAGNPTLTNEVHAVMMTDGEIIDYPSIETNLGLDIFSFPDQNRQNFVQWLNNNLVPEWFVFSGKYRINDDFEHLYDGFQINGKKYNTDEVQRLTIETGFILKEESLLVKEMIKSKLAFIKLEGNIYRALPISPKLVELEAEQNLINYELEFLIVK